MCDHKEGIVSGIIASKTEGVTGKVQCCECGETFPLGQEHEGMELFNEHEQPWDQSEAVIS